MTFKSGRDNFFFFLICHGHFFGVTGTLLEIVTGKEKKCHGHFSGNCHGHSQKCHGYAFFKSANGIKHQVVFRPVFIVVTLKNETEDRSENLTFRNDHVLNFVSLVFFE